MSYLFDNSEVFIMWFIKISIAVFVLALILPKTQKKTILTKKSIVIKYDSSGRKTKLVSILEGISNSPLMTMFKLKEDSEEYSKLTRMIYDAGGLGGLTPNIVNMVKFAVPIILMVIGQLIYLASITVSATSTLDIEQATKIVEQMNNEGGFFQAKIIPTNTTKPMSKIFDDMSNIFIATMLLILVPKFLIKLKIRARKNTIADELPVISSFAIILLDSGNNTVYNILKLLADSSSILRPYFITAINEYTSDPRRALTNLSNSIDDEGFKVVCNTLIQANELDKQRMAENLRENVENLKRIQMLKVEGSIKKKPILFVLILTLPLMNVMLITMYPWLIKSIEIIGTGF